MLMNKIAAYDYCETLIDAQSGNEFLLQYAQKKLGLIKRLKAFFYGNLRFFKKNRKWLLLALLKGESQQSIDSFAREFSYNWLKLHENHSLISDLRDKNRNGFGTVIISAGYDVYINYHNLSIGSDVVIANRLEFIDGISTGKIIGKDCYGAEKVARLDAVFSLDKVDLINSYFYSDCMSDKPLFKLFGNSYFVSPNRLKKIDI